MLVAGLEKNAGIALSERDVFLNVAGGIRLDDPAADLGVLAAVLSSWQGKPVREESVFIGEVGLGGELRPVSRIEQRLGEAARLGFRSAVIPTHTGLNADLGGLGLTSGDSFLAVLPA